MFIMEEKLMKKQIIQLLQIITACNIKEFNLEYNTKVIDCAYPLIPKVLKKGRQNNFYIRFKAPMTAE